MMWTAIRGARSWLGCNGRLLLGSFSRPTTPEFIPLRSLFPEAKTPLFSLSTHPECEGTRPS